MPLALSGTLRLEDYPQQAAQKNTSNGFLHVIRSKADLGSFVKVDRPTMIGRDQTCAITLHDFGVSRQHAVITPTDGDQFVLKDLESTNGTLANGVPIRGDHVLRDGEKIIVGDTVLRFGLADELDVSFHNQVSTLVGTDPLTGLPSKRRFDEEFEFALEQARFTDGTLALLMMDMDGLKQINDTHGHLFGAFSIGETGRMIADVIGSRGQACRFGGDEFSVFLPGHGLQQAVAIAEEIRFAVETAGLEKDGIALKPTISVGVAEFPASADKILDLVAAADKALYRAKEKGKNRVEI